MVFRTAHTIYIFRNAINNVLLYYFQKQLSKIREEKMDFRLYCLPECSRKFDIFENNRIPSTLALFVHSDRY